ncbi:hypothetical protein AB0395_31695 [Streptosporangium sp. NPDC051023]|uniref:hypothetical protein n=1 Tax=Streptosporangium sp. NPDC051023 TaxID=3155410 RepID=UPI00344B78A5
MGKTVDGVFLASMLTVIGYSVNDKVVVFAPPNTKNESQSVLIHTRTTLRLFLWR